MERGRTSRAPSASGRRLSDGRPARRAGRRRPDDGEYPRSPAERAARRRGRRNRRPDPLGDRRSAASAGRGVCVCSAASSAQELSICELLAVSSRPPSRSSSFSIGSGCRRTGRRRRAKPDAAFRAAMKRFLVAQNIPAQMGEQMTYSAAEQILTSLAGSGVTITEPMQAIVVEEARKDFGTRFGDVEYLTDLYSGSTSSISPRRRSRRSPRSGSPRREEASCTDADPQ